MFLFKQPPNLPRCSHRIVRLTESFRGNPADTGISQVSSEDESNPNGFVLDARSVQTIEDLSWLYRTARKHSTSQAFRKPGGRVVIIRSCPTQIEEPESVAASEAIVGFAKSLAKENGTRGATVNLIRDATPFNDAENALEKPLEWLLSHHSCYVTGQEIVVSANPRIPAEIVENRSILISGAAGGIGRATAKFLNTEQQPSSKLLLVDHPSTQSKLDQVAVDLRATAPPQRQVEVLPLDLTQADAGEILAQASADIGGLERVIHAAGITRDKTLKNMDYESAWKPVLEVNMGAAFKIDHALLSTPGALLPTTTGNCGSSFVYFGSTSGISGNAGQSNYAASKSGLLGYAEAMAKRHPEHSFRVVSPGFIDTDMTGKMPFLVRMVASKLNALGQAGKPEDVAAAVAFLSSPEATGLAPGFHLRVCGMFMGGR
ncbi:oxoacyl-[acyl-carrier-protein] reductase FabG [Seminavis robusta]|uniref:Oxoacyl-[acyl-carrier-protein] reductase FabG n=1 Tax=Seminavis robusta TaxID=568900 RepID=A0A9N8HBJ8_9STRA|nr:oxoacyl-[acyl-carrier-protein] reductase FabG [Seminavis robusta]|eukprot:Sro185_g080350.1 oxoacyl-[acyl-carrier-protein] reductase FabG (432) ;mRNA; f:50429-51724